MHPPRSLGLHDMSGNVWEWVQDKKTSYNKVGTNNPINEDSGHRRVYRGGSWSNISNSLRCSYRYNYLPPSSSSNLGFRLLRSR